MSTEQALAPGALDEPTVPVRRGYITAVVLANLGIMLAFYTPIQNLLPRLAEQVAPDGKEAALAWITAAGAFASIVFNPLAGALSDRTTSRLGPSQAVGALRLAGGRARDPRAVVAVDRGGPRGRVVLLPGHDQRRLRRLTATIPDQVPVPQRGLVSGWVGLAQTVGVVLGVAIVSFVVLDLEAGLVVTAVLLVLLVLPFVLKLAGHPVAAPDRGRRSGWASGSRVSGSRRASTRTSAGRGSPASS